MTIKALQTNSAPAAIGPYSQAIQVTAALSTVYISGQIPLDPETGEIIGEGDIAKETVQVLENIKAIAKTSGGDMKNIVKVTIYLTNLNHFASVNAIYSQSFSEPYPARACVEVSKLPKGVQVEMDAVLVV